MEVNNQSNGTVNWTQGGSNPQPLGAPADKSGTLDSGKKTDQFDPGGNAPWWVTFAAPGKSTSSPEIKQNQASATVTLNSDWTVTVS